MNRNEILSYLVDTERDKELFQRADETRKKYCGDRVYIRGIIDFSNCCSKSCLYCGLRKENKKLERYRMEEDEIIETASQIISSGIKTVVLQSGDDSFYTREKICRLVSAIKKKGDVAVTLSIGERCLNDYRAFRDAGADRYLLKHETANERLYEKLHPGQSLRTRRRILEYLKETGYQTGAGNIVGLPGQGIEDLCDDILFLKEMDMDMAGIGPFMPQRDTPLADRPMGSPVLTRKVLALTRIVMKNTLLPVTTAFVSACPDNGLVKGLKEEANVIMVNFTPLKYRKNYAIYDKKVDITLETAKKSITDAGRNPF